MENTPHPLEGPEHIGALVDDFDGDGFDPRGHDFTAPHTQTLPPPLDAGACTAPHGDPLR
jgi:hypothetical protein